MNDKVRSHNFGEEWERSTLLTVLKDKKAKEDEEKKIYHTFNIHCGMGYEHRMKASEILGQLSEEIFEEDSYAKVIMAGDFNTYADWGGSEQISILKNYGLNDATDDLTFPNGVTAQSTYIAFPYDFGADSKRLNLNGTLSKMSIEECKETVFNVFDKECKAYTSLLDHGFYAGFENATATLMPTPLFGDLDDYSEKSVKDYILKNYNNGPAFASDHQPLFLSFGL